MRPAARGLIGALALGALALVPAPGGPAALAQSGPPPAPAPTLDSPPMPRPMPRVISPSDAMLRQYQLDTAQKVSEGRSFHERYRQTREFASCAQRVSPGRIVILLSQPLGSSGERRAASSLMRFAPGCLGRPIVVSTQFLRGAVAEAALEKHRTADPDRARLVNSDRIEHFLKATPSAEQEGDESAAALARYTQCQVLLAPGLARKMVDSSPDTPDEAEHRERLNAGTEACGRMAAPSQLAALVHRSYLAEALYHWTRSSGNFESS